MSRAPQESAPEQGPSLGLRFRHQVLGHAMEVQYPGHRVLRQLNVSELGEVIGHATSADEAIELAKAWAGDPKDYVLQPRRYLP